MPHVIQQSIVITLRILPFGVSQCVADRVTASAARAWLEAVGQTLRAELAMPACQIFVRQMPLAQGTQFQILLCWIVLQAQHQELGDFESSVE